MSTNRRWRATGNASPTGLRGLTAAVQRLAIVSLTVMLWSGAASAQPATLAPPIFEVPEILARCAKLKQGASTALRSQKFEVAEELAGQAVELVPFDPQSRYLLTRAQAGLNRLDAAFENLQNVLQQGINNPQAVRSDPLLKNLVSDPRFEQLLAEARTGRAATGGWRWKVEPFSIEGRRAHVAATNTAWSMQLGAFVTHFRVDGSSADGETVRGHGDVGRMIRGWHALGSSSGLHGVCYDNFDNGHSRLDTSQFPQLSLLTYSDEVRKRKLNTGLQNRFLHRGIVVIGNSSTAITGTRLWRSQARLAYSNPQSMRMLYAQYVSNQLYLYPEHRDHDPGHNGEGGGYGDVFAVNTPYLLVSQGSSFSDQPFLDAVACTIAALRPTTKQFLTQRGALMPTVQMILRRSYGEVAADGDYLTGRAHPTVFDGDLLDVGKMVELAHQIDRGTEPPLVALRVVEEDDSRAGRDYFHSHSTERLFDTPAAIARVYRTVRRQRRIVVSAEGSRDLNQRPLKYHWAVLRGDPSRIEINPLNEDRSVVEIIVAWHPRRPVSPGSKLESNRVDVGAFVDNGEFFSAPAFVTHFCSDNEQREYDSAGRLRSVEYSSANYVDPTIEIPKLWRDEYRYDPQGNPTGWLRIRPGGDSDLFMPDGSLVDERDEQGRPLTGSVVEYFATRDDGQPPRLDYRPTGQTIQF